MSAKKLFTSSPLHLFPFLKLLGKATGLFLYLGIVTGVLIGALQLGLYHPDVFVYFSLPSAGLTIALKIAAVFVQKMVIDFL